MSVCIDLESREIAVRIVEEGSVSTNLVGNAVLANNTKTELFKFTTINKACTYSLVALLCECCHADESGNNNKCEFFHILY